VSEGLFVRQVTESDAAAIAELFTEFNEILGADGLSDDEAFMPQNVHVSPEQIALRLRQVESVEKVLIASIDSEPAGFAALRLVPYIGQDAPYAELTQLYVRERFQRRRVGAALVQAAEALATDAGATCVHIITGHANSAARAFYQSQGYSTQSVEYAKYFKEAARHA
jgi:ribosomal protein S18 acetylase RimI-like enzyme